MSMSYYAAVTKKYGIFALLAALINALLRRFFDLVVERVFVLNVAAIENVNATGFECRQLTIEDFSHISLPDYQLDKTFLKEAFSRKDICIGVYKNSTLAAYGWYSEWGYPHSHHHNATVNKASLLGYRAFTLPEFRRTSARKVLLAEIAAVCKERSIQNIIIAIDWTNFASIQSGIKNKYQPHGIYIAFFRKNIRVLHYHTPAANTTGYELNSTTKPLPASDFTISVICGEGQRFIQPLLDSELNINTVIQLVSPEELKTNPHTKKNLLRRLVNFRENRGKNKFINSLKDRGIKHHVLSQSDLHSIELTLKATAPSLVMVYRAPLFPETILQIPHLGMINLHPSLLPKYRGGFPILWCAMDHCLKGGASIHFLTRKTDAGNILLQESFDIPLGTNYQWHVDKSIFEVGLPLFIEAGKLLQNNETLKNSIQNESLKNTYAKRLSNEQMWDMIEWNNWKVDRVYHYLSCLPFWQNPLGLQLGLNTYASWKVTGFETKPHDSKTGTHLQKGKTLQLFCTNGWVIIEGKLVPLDIIKKIIRKILKKP